MAFDRGSRTYHLTDEQMSAFRTVPIERRLEWVEELARFVKLAREGQVGNGIDTAAQVNRNIQPIDRM